ncbi:MAG: hypothetical protein A2107_10070 [Verrucomicrobia bacterium GWF2_62_7]|nr:MAG: hypothetical protein A2107_10070 [Verrucomicrobia bacterium GWF2_62_7]
MNPADYEKRAALNTVAHMAAAARTAPKTRGIDNISTVIIDDPDVRAIVAAKMKEIAQRDNMPFCERDANCIANSPAILVVGVASNPAELNCGMCGCPTCDELRQQHGICAYNSMDLGIAIGSAAALAAQFHIDNRVMYSIARACIELKFFGENVKQALAIPLSVTGKNPFFDRK